MPPICVDAGGLDLLPEHFPNHFVITPHAGELARLLSRLGEQVALADVLAAPLHWATRAHELTGATVLLKGASTIVVGEGESGRPHVLVSKSAPAWLATAGAGDVLAGILGSFLAQQDETLWADDAALPADVAASAAYVHGFAAAIAAHAVPRESAGAHLFGSRSLQDEDGDEKETRPWLEPVATVGRPIIASDVVAALPQTIERIIS